MVARRFLAVFHPEAVFENTRLETTVAEHVFRTRGRVLLVAGWRGVYGEEAWTSGRPTPTTTRAADQQLPKLERGEAVDTREVAAAEKETKPPRRYSDASLLAAMETAGKLVDDDELREAMKDSGIGTPATRAAIIERLIDVGYVERDGRALVCHREGPQRHPPARRAPADVAVADRRLGAPAGARSSTARSRASASCATSRSSPARPSHELDAKLKDVRIPRANLGPCPVCGHDIVENRKGFSCWSREDPGLRLRDLEVQGRQDAAGRGRARADRHRAHRAGP